MRFGQIRKLPSSRYQASYPGPDDRRDNGPITFTHKADAQAWIAAERRLIEYGTWTSPAARAEAVREAERVEAQREAAEAHLATARIRVGDWEVTTSQQVGIRYDGPLDPRTRYEVDVLVTGTSGATATASTSFRTGRMGRPWAARWIIDATYETPNKTSPAPMVFRTRFPLNKPVQRAWIEATALGVYELELNGAKVGDGYFAPGFTSYGRHLQYQTYDVTGPLTADNRLHATVAGGWAVGFFTFARKNRIYADRQALLAELHLEYEDGSSRRSPPGPTGRSPRTAPSGWRSGTTARRSTPGSPRTT